MFNSDNFDFFDMLALIIASLFLSSLSPNVYAQTAPINLGGGVTLYPNGSMVVKEPTQVALKEVLAKPTIIMPASVTAASKTAGNVNVKIPEVKIPVKSGVLGTVGKNILKKAGVIGGGITAYEVASGLFDLACEYHNICKKPDSTTSEPIIQKRTDLSAWSVWQGTNTGGFTEPSAMCNYAFNVAPNSYGNYSNVHISPSQTPNTQLYEYVDCNYSYNSDGSIISTYETYSRHRDSTTQEFSYAPLTDSDYDQYEDWMNQPTRLISDQMNVVKGAIATGEPLPVDNMDYEPKVVSLAKVTVASTQMSSSALPENQTTETQETLTVKPSATNPNTAVIDSTVTTTTTNADGTQTQSTTTTSQDTETPAKEETKWPTIEFDSVPDVELPKVNLTPTFVNTTFGHASCPANPTASLATGSFVVMHYDIICSSFAKYRPLVLLLCFLLSAYIISGAVKND